MHKVDSDGHASNLFEDKDAGAGKAGTALTEDWHNDVQEEIVNVIEDAGITLAKGDRRQLSEAVMSKRVYSSGTPTFTVPANTSWIYVTAVAGGGGGGGGCGKDVSLGGEGAGGGGGGAGAAVLRQPIAVTAGDTMALTIGAGGTGGAGLSGTGSAGTATAGTTGGQTIINPSGTSGPFDIVLSGGGGGGGGDTSGAVAGGAGGIAGTGNGGSSYLAGILTQLISSAAGSVGDVGETTTGTPATVAGGRGATSIIGGSDDPVAAVSGPDADYNGAGGGGGGARNSTNTGSDGGDGGGGLVIIEW